jgi:hypothetical protein
LPTQVEAVNAFREFVEALGAADRIEEKIKPILPELLRHFFQMASVVEAMDVILCIDTIVERMGEDIQPYAVDCCREVCSKSMCSLHIILGGSGRFVYNAVARMSQLFFHGCHSCAIVITWQSSLLGVPAVIT